MVEDAVAHLEGEVQPAAVLFQHVDDAQRLLVVRKPVRREAGEHPLARMTEGCMPEVVPERNRLREVLVEGEAARDRTRDLRDVDRVRHARAEMIPFR